MNEPQSYVGPISIFLQVLNVIFMALILYWDIYFIFIEGSGSISSGLFTLAYWAAIMIILAINYYLLRNVDYNPLLYWLAILFIVLSFSGILLNFLAQDGEKTLQLLWTALMNSIVPIIVALLNLRIVLKTVETNEN